VSEWLAGEYVLQHLVVSLVAIGAAGVVARKVLGVFEKPRTPSGSAPGCDHCGAAQKHHQQKP
jgi:hypothetical protein